MEGASPWRRLTWLQRTLLVLGGSVLLSVAAVVIAEQHLEALLLHVIKDRTGREVRIAGPFTAHLLARHPSLSASQVSVGNPPWMSPGTMAELGRVVLQLGWRAALPPLEIRRLEIDDAMWHLVREADGRANWQARAQGPGKGPPLMQSLSMPDARVELHDERRHLEFSGHVSAGDAAGGAVPPALRIAGAGELNGRPVSFSVDAEPLATARHGRPYHFTFEERSSGSRLSGHGYLEQPFDFRVLQGSFAAAGEDMQDLYFLVGLRFPDTGAYRLSGRLIRRDLRFEYRDLAATSGESDMGGTLTVDSSHAPPQLSGELHSHWLRLADLGARAAGRAPPSPPTPGRLIPATPLRVSGMQRSHAQVSFRAHALGVGAVKLTDVRFDLAIDKGVLSVAPFSASLAGGSVSGDARLDAVENPPRGALDLRFNDVRLEQLLGKNTTDPPLAGALSGRVHLSGAGQSLHELAASASGTLTAVVPRGAMRASIAQAASLNVTGALAALYKRHRETGVRCGVASFEAQHGVLDVSSFVLDTDDALITAAGEVRLESETLDLLLRGRPKHAGLTLRSSVAIRGSLEHPQIRLAGHGALAQTGGAVALGVLLTPLATVLAFVSPGLTHNADCAALLAQAQPSDHDPRP
jgi:uncharacterized protein involved in outer membrane biogenesis